MSGRNQSTKLSGTALLRLAAFKEMAADHIKRVGRALQMRREELGLSKAEFARTVHADVRTISRYEKGETSGALNAMEDLAAGLKTTEDAIFALAASLREDIPKPTAPVTDSDRLDRIEKQLQLLLKQAGVTEPDVASVDEEARVALSDLDRRDDDEDRPGSDGEKAAGS
jgi:transcriptional regulator with XRE-family HTH domain